MKVDPKDLARLERVDALTRELTRVVRCHVDSLDHDEAMLIGTMSLATVFVLSLHTGIREHNKAAPSTVALRRAITRAPWDASIESARDLAAEGVVC